MTQVLTDAGYGVLEAPNGRQALGFIGRQTGIDLMICDLVMQKQEGIEMIRTIRDDHPALPVIAISGAPGAELFRIARRLGTEATLRKPIRQDELLRTVQRCLGA